MALSTTLLHPSTAPTMGDLRQLTACLPDDIPLAIEGFDSDFNPPGLFLECSELPHTLVITEIMDAHE